MSHKRYNCCASARGERYSTYLQVAQAKLKCILYTASVPREHSCLTYRVTAASWPLIEKKERHWTVG